MTDEDGVRRTIALYAQCNDDQDADGFTALFAENGHFVSGNAGDVVGRPAIREWVKGTFAQKGPDGRALHLFGNPVISVQGDTANAAVDCVEYRRASPDAPWTIHHVVRYHDRFVKQGNDWLFSEITYIRP
jgi:uncharacterized protein (TIGR02246 family)